MDLGPGGAGILYLDVSLRLLTSNCFVHIAEPESVVYDANCTRSVIGQRRLLVQRRKDQVTSHLQAHLPASPTSITKHLSGTERQ